ncbi:TIGR02206 family membrane protein [Sporosarcina pasteurii]|uniref:Predicted integral membrane protein n=1 Tax=Sporosarcina pasteurii TaxID=1474 RepID=A0A380BR22_SPOPA|nr:TIGR02206 family membrane protein [Sporosarcina pasteurii]MDS9471198.1 TIGR02206 family membrane protein [Sporosarcina pasteurii]QBQ05165.1 TIGR02206 family membrane protein [Sporosarcina pasteurii]SUJ05548.1 Predicted integral membrane protein [Sporosarcina pasteurii]
MGGKSGTSFIMFSTPHVIAIMIMIFLILLVWVSSKRGGMSRQRGERFQQIFALSLLAMEWLYYVWMAMSGKWDARYSLPLELCSMSLYVAVVLLWMNKRQLYPFVFFAGVGGALQAIVTPDLELDFPHFRFFHFFYTHIGIIVTAFYFTWVKGYRPTFKGIIQTMITLNVIAILVYLFNTIAKSNYMFLNGKPKNGSLIDYLGPYPWYLLSLEGVALITFLLLWLLFKRKRR